MTEFSKSDSYLFAKTAWMIIREDNRGFRGPYTRIYGNYLRKNDYGVKTLEPIHRMLEKATKNDYEERITIDECVECLEEQRLIVNNQHTDIEQLIYEEKIAEIVANEEPSEISYVDMKVIHDILTSSKFNISMEFSDAVTNRQISLNFIDLYEDVENRMFLFEDDIKRKVLMRIEKITIQKDKTFVISTGTIERRDGFDSISMIDKGMFMEMSDKYAVYGAVDIKCNVRELVLKDTSCRML